MIDSFSTQLHERTPASDLVKIITLSIARLLRGASRPHGGTPVSRRPVSFDRNVIVYRLGPKFDYNPIYSSHRHARLPSWLVSLMVVLLQVGS